DETFEVAPPLRWLEVGNDVTERHWLDENGQFYIPEPEPKPTEPLTKLTILHRLRDAGAVEGFAAALAAEENVYTAMMWDAAASFTRGDDDWLALEATLREVEGLDVDEILA